MSDGLMSGTYKTLPEQKEVLSPAEERFERLRQTSGLVFGPLAFVIVALLPLDLEPNQQMLAAILAFTIVWWLTEAVPIPVTAVIALALCVLFAVVEAPEGDTTGDVVYGSFSSPTVFLFIGAFIIARAMMINGLDRRFALRVLALPGVGQSTYRIVIAFGAIAAIISAFISNTTTAAMLLPIGLGMLEALGDLVSDQSGRQRPVARLRFGTALMLMISYGAGVGGLLTPIGTPPNLIGIGFIEQATGTRITFFDWVLMAAPIVLAMFAVLCVVLLLLNKPEVRRISGAQEYVAAERAQLGPMSRGEKNTLVVFFVAVTLWVLPGIVALLAGDDSAAYTAVSGRLDEGTVAILAAALLFVLPVDWEQRRFTMNWNEAAGIDWGTIILFGAGIAIGTLMSETGFAEVLGTGIAEALGFSGLLAISAVAALIAILISETTSNTASATIVVPIVIPIAEAAGVDPMIPALAAVVGASFGFMMPVSTPQNAVVYGSGLIPITKMVRSGIAFDIAGLVLTVLLIPVMVRLVGLV